MRRVVHLLTSSPPHCSLTAEQCTSSSFLPFVRHATQVQSIPQEIFGVVGLGIMLHMNKQNDTRFIPQHTSE
ncbi:hypothetical protein E2C01_026698 [Portunus trituberculatus]|uniref:Uncharacterized protein n=1 Tax=Portunus trituberculatus TaxID=210409 RepID=A0A5B7EG84_PORTR|nr:hypothetical protein [Portunus trituberculatus]